MIFPDVPLKDWLKKYPELSLLERICEGCGNVMKADRPFITKGYAGITSRDCMCGKSRGHCASQITTTQSEHSRWSDLIDRVKVTRQVDDE